MSTLKFNQWLNPDNSENYKCRAWVNFNGTGTVAIRSSGNVSSITDAGVGFYTVNLISAFSDVNYAVVSNSNDNGTVRSVTNLSSASTATFAISTTQNGSNTAQDASIVSVAVYR